jgi:undecaprenyl-diphosphatase
MTDLRHDGETAVGLVTLGLLAGLVLAFGAVAGLVAAGDTAAFDRLVLLALRDSADPARLIGPPWAAEAARDITSLGSTIVLIAISAIVPGYLTLTGRRAAALAVVLSTGGGLGLAILAKLVFARARPDVVPHAVEVFTLSFPSSHAMLSAAAYLTLGGMLARTSTDRRVRIYVMSVAVTLALAIGASRVYLGVHWPSDVLAGWCLGWAWALVCLALAQWLQRSPTPGQGQPLHPASPSHNARRDP